MKNLPSVFKTTPVVFAVKDTYQILVPVTCPVLMWVKVGNSVFYDALNGVLRSDCTVHKMTVPMHLLDTEKEYTIVYRKIIDTRKAYHTKTEDPVEFKFSFKSVMNDTINIYHISDTHNKVASPLAAGKYFGDKLDLLVLNGDIPDHSGNINHFDVIYEIAAGLTEGRIPVVFSRGNHDMRGVYAEKLGDFTPTDNGKSYYTFRLGNLWGLVLDCGEDKVDSFPEYGNTICCETFRKEETAYLYNLVKMADQEYQAPGVLYKLVIVHNPFTYTKEPPFDIEQDTYSEWAKILRDEIKPDLMLCGHLHATEIFYPGTEKDMKGQACPVVIGSNPFMRVKEEDIFIGAAVTLSPEQINVKFTDNKGLVKASINL